MTTQQIRSDFAEVKSYIEARGIKPYVPVFTAIDPCLTPYIHRMRAMMADKGPRIPTDKDADLVARMVAVVEVLKANAGC